jgi:hypothetical protein
VPPTKKAASNGGSPISISRARNSSFFIAVAIVSGFSVTWWKRTPSPVTVMVAE